MHCYQTKQSNGGAGGAGGASNFTKRFMKSLPLSNVFNQVANFNNKHNQKQTSKDDSFRVLVSFFYY